MEENKTLSHEESISIIQKMINQAKVNVKQSSFHLLFWGWLIMLTSLVHFILLKHSTFNHPEYVWFSIFIGIPVSFIYGFIMGKKSKTRTYADSIYVWVWIGFVVSYFLTIYYIEFDPKLISTLVLVLAGYATFVSGHILKFKPLIFGGILFWFGSLASFIIASEYALLVNSVAVLVGYIIPGHLLRNRVQDVTF